MKPQKRHLGSIQLLRAALGAGLMGLIGVTTAADAPPKPEKVAKKAPATTNAPKPLAKVDPLDVALMAKRIDTHVQSLLSQDNIPVSPRSSDAEFCRRLYLDLTGRIPSADQTLTFLNDTHPDKREKLVDTVLASKNYAVHMADIWQSLLMPPNSENRRLDPEPLSDWLEKSFAANKPWDAFSRELLTASGEQDKNGATTYFLANSSIDRLTDSVCKLFMGVQLQCAQCHNHPFNPAWKQDDYWATAAFFMKVKAQPPRGKDAKPPRVVENNMPPNKKMLPESAKTVAAKYPAGAKAELSPKDSYRPAFAKWLTNETNPFFARATVNRVWAQVFGRGLVHPIDDIHEGNPASHPALLDELASQFQANKYDMHFLFKAICLSEAYQRTSKPVAGNEKVSAHYLSRMPVKVLTPEQMFDSVTDLFVAAQAKAEQEVAKKEDKKDDKAKTDKPGKAERKNLKIQGRPGPAPRNQFIAFFKGEEGPDQTEYQAGIPQVLRLMNSPQFNNQALLRLLEPKAPPKDNIQKLYLSILSRKPTESESAKLTKMVTQAGPKPMDMRQAYADICWVLLNSSEFALNH